MSFGGLEAVDFTSAGAPIDQVGAAFGLPAQQTSPQTVDASGATSMAQPSEVNPSTDRYDLDPSAPTVSPGAYVRRAQRLSASPGPGPASSPMDYARCSTARTWQEASKLYLATCR